MGRRQNKKNGKNGNERNNKASKKPQKSESRTHVPIDGNDTEIKKLEDFQATDIKMSVDVKNNPSSPPTATKTNTAKNDKKIYNNNGNKVSENKQGSFSSTETAKKSRPAYIPAREVPINKKEVCSKEFRHYILNMSSHENINWEENQPTLIFKERDQIKWVTCPWLWYILGNRYGSPLSQHISKKNVNEELLSKKEKDFNLEYFDSCQVNAISIYITSQDFSHESVQNFSRQCRLYSRHVYVQTFPIQKSMSHPNFLKAIDSLASQIVDCVIECWYLGWQVAVFADNSLIEKSGIFRLLHALRNYCDIETLDVVIVTYRYTYTAKESKSLYKAGCSTIITNTGNFFEKLKLSKNEETIKFYEKDQKYYEFTNFWHSDFVKDGYCWKTSEHYFQAHKFTDKKSFDKIHQAYSPRSAFDIGHNSPNVRADWDTNDEHGIPYKDRVMKEGVYAKFKYNRSLTLKLLSTGEADLVEHTKNDGYWGDNGDGSGQNRLGSILENIRHQLFQEELKRIRSTNHYKKRSLIRSKWYITDLSNLLKSGV